MEPEEELLYICDAEFIYSCNIVHKSDNVILAFMETDKCYPKINCISFGDCPSCFIQERERVGEVYELSFVTLLKYELFAINEFRDGINLTFYKKG